LPENLWLRPEPNELYLKLKLEERQRIKHNIMEYNKFHTIKQNIPSTHYTIINLAYLQSGAEKNLVNGRSGLSIHSYFQWPSEILPADRFQMRP
jgi:hypothetical protein